MALAPNGALQDWALELGSRSVFALEGTWSLGARLCLELLAVGYSVVEINRPDRSTRRRLGKDLDAVFRVGKVFSNRSGWGLSTSLVLGHWLLC